MSLVLVGVWLSALGVCDLGRASHDTVGRPARGVPGRGVAGAPGRVVVLRPGPLRVPGWWPAPRCSSAGSWPAGWSPPTVPSTRPSAAGAALPRPRLRSGRGRHPGVVLGVQAVDRALEWPPFLDRTVAAHWPMPDAVVAVGVVVAQLATVNIVVRLLLDAVGVPATTNEKQLKGGRVLGPMERVFIVGLGAVGDLTAAAVVVAAKGLLRFPELQRAQRGDARPGVPPDGPSDVTEYFLIGSFASWLLALGGAALIHLA